MSPAPNGRPVVAVIGLGVIGAAVSAHLAETGFRVVALESDRPLSGTSATTFAWVNANNKHPEDYYELNRAGLAAHIQAARNGRPWFHRSGHLEVAHNADHAQRLAAKTEFLRTHDYEVRELSAAQVEAVEPSLSTNGRVELAVHYREEGYCDPAAFVADHIARAQSVGAAVRAASSVKGLQPIPGGVRVNMRDGTRRDVDRVVVCAGRWTQSLLETGGVEVPLHDSNLAGSSTVGFLGTTVPLPVKVDGVVTTTRVNLRPDGHGRLVVQTLDLDGDADPASEPPAAVAQEMSTRLRHAFGISWDPPLERVVVGQRALPYDGLTVCGPVEDTGIYVVVTHSGITLAPLLGRLVAEELAGSQAPMLSGFRPDRFLTQEMGTVAAPRLAGEQ